MDNKEKEAAVRLALLIPDDVHIVGHVIGDDGTTYIVLWEQDGNGKDYHLALRKNNAAVGVFSQYDSTDNKNFIAAHLDKLNRWQLSQLFECDSTGYLSSITTIIERLQRSNTPLDFQPADMLLKGYANALLTLSNHERLSKRRESQAATIARLQPYRAEVEKLNAIISKRMAK